MGNKYFSNEIVFRGHPDKVCDQISASILCECLSQDPFSRVGVEVAGGKGKIFITGEITTRATLDVTALAKSVLEDVGYSKKYKIIDNIGKQSRDIEIGVNTGGAGDNGMMFGYACDDTPQLLPLAMVILQKLARRYERTQRMKYGYYPDGKAQITGLYDENFKLVRIKTFTICYQNDGTDEEVKNQYIQQLAEDLCNEHNIPVERYLINPTGKFTIGGFEGDAGLTGRKIVVDAYQGFAPVGGGCMNGKDPTKVDVSGAYIARKFAVELLKEHNLKWCEVQVSYAIGVTTPLAIYIDSDKGNLDVPDEWYVRAEPQHIISDLSMIALDYVEQAKFGHFTNGAEFSYRSPLAMTLKRKW
jgi:S-adenosylmethionine synthetase